MKEIHQKMPYQFSRQKKFRKKEKLKALEHVETTNLQSNQHLPWTRKINSSLSISTISRLRELQGISSENSYRNDIKN